jgi:hypothetical protein
MAALKGGTLCFTHNPKAARQRTAARRKGGHATRTPKAAGAAPVAAVADLFPRIDYSAAMEPVLGVTVDWLCGLSERGGREGRKRRRLGKGIGVSVQDEFTVHFQGATPHGAEYWSPILGIP